MFGNSEIYIFTLYKIDCYEKITYLNYFILFHFLNLLKYSKIHLVFRTVKRIYWFCISMKDLNLNDQIF